MEKRGVAGTAYNAHIAKIAALPCVDRFCVLSLPLLALIKCWNAATSAICRNVVCNATYSAKLNREIQLTITKTRIT